jgi:chorismate mutase
MKQLENYRKQIDRLDKKIVVLISKRKLVTEKVAKFKKDNSLTAKDSKREKLMFKSREEWAGQLGADKILVKDIFRKIIKATVKDHKRIMEDK